MVNMYSKRCRILGMVVLACIYLVASNAGAQLASKHEAIAPSQGVICLFDGESLQGLDTWLKDTKQEDPRNVFRVTDGMLHITGDGLGAVITRDRFCDYHLVLEYKWGERTWHEREKAARDSGLLINSNGKLGGYEGIWMPALEVQIIEGGVGDFVFVLGDDESGKPVPLALTASIHRDRDGEAVWDAKGQPTKFALGNTSRINWFGRDPDWTDTIGFRGPLDKDSEFGMWTRLDVISDGGHVEVFVNGTKVNEAFDVSPNEGRIQLQSELAEIFIRRWELWPVNKGPKIESAKQ